MTKKQLEKRLFHVEAAMDALANVLSKSCEAHNGVVCCKCEDGDAQDKFCPLAATAFYIVNVDDKLKSDATVGYRKECWRSWAYFEAQNSQVQL